MRPRRVEEDFSYAFTAPRGGTLCLTAGDARAKARVNPWGRCSLPSDTGGVAQQPFLLTHPFIPQRLQCNTASGGMSTKSRLRRFRGILKRDLPLLSVQSAISCVKVTHYSDTSVAPVDVPVNSGAY